MAAHKKRFPGISRIDQLEKRTHGFFVRLTRKGKIYNAFFADQSYGGKNKALAAAQKHYRKLLREHGQISRRDRAQISVTGPVATDPTATDPSATDPSATDPTASCPSDSRQRGNHFGWRNRPLPSDTSPDGFTPDGRIGGVPLP